MNVYGYSASSVYKKMTSSRIPHLQRKNNPYSNFFTRVIPPVEGFSSVRQTGTIYFLQRADASPLPCPPRASGLARTTLQKMASSYKCIRRNPLIRGFLKRRANASNKGTNPARAIPAYPKAYIHLSPRYGKVWTQSTMPSTQRAIKTYSVMIRLPHKSNHFHFRAARVRMTRTPIQLKPSIILSTFMRD